jgi:glycosyltransferase involved in cell wall biosynthesis
MNILFLNEYALPHIVSGAERSMMALSEALSKKINVFTLSPNLSLSKTRLESNQLKYPFPIKIKPGQTLSPFWFNNPIFWLYTAYFILKSVRNRHINLIHVHGKYIQPAAIIASWFSKIPVITTVRDFKFLCPLALCYTHQQKKCSWNYYLKKEIPFYLKHYAQTSLLKPLIYLNLIFAKFWQSVLKFFLNQSTQVVTVGPQLKKLYQTASIKKTIYIYNLPPVKFKPQTPKYKLKNKKILISVGKLSYGKGTDTLLQAMESVLKSNPDIYLYLAGSKNISLKQAFPQNTKYLGKLKHNDIQNLYQSADAFIILSRWPEPLSRAGLEALTSGLPIIASNRGGNQELIKNNGYLVNPDDPKQVITVIKKIFNHPQFSKNSQLLIQTRFNRQQITQRHITLYQSLL